MDIELILFLLIVIFALSGMLSSLLLKIELSNIILISSNILFILYGGFMAITK